jgi:phospho-N-acetylmuramoyl-pentapeptide-transferase
MDCSRYPAISVLALGILRSSQEILFSNYLNIMYIPNSEMTVFIAAFVGSLIGFLWYKSGICFMGDTGSLTIGIIAVLAIAVRKELLIPLLVL